MRSKMIRTMAAGFLGLLFMASAAAAQPCPTGGLTTLTNGTNADATQVMANFTYVANCVNNYSPPSVPPGTIAAYSGFTLPAGWLWANGATVLRATYPGLLTALTSTSAVTITIASPGVITWANHGLSNAWPIRFSTTGALPTGLSAGVTYYIVQAMANTFQVASTPGGSAINTTGTQSGTQTAIFAPYGNGDGTTTFALPDLRGRVAFGLDNLGGATAANNLPVNGTYIKGTSPGSVGGEHQHVLTVNEMPAHGHTYVTGGNLAPGVNVRGASGDGTSLGAPSTNATGGGAPHNTLPPMVMSNYIIKY